LELLGVGRRISIVIGDMGSEEAERQSSFGRSLAVALFDCLAEEVIPLALFALLVLPFAFFLYLMGSAVYDLAFDLSHMDVGARLDALSISPDKWIGRS
jgi:hypothetical protein